MSRIIEVLLEIEDGKLLGIYTKNAGDAEKVAEALGASYIKEARKNEVGGHGEIIYAMPGWDEIQNDRGYTGWPDTYYDSDDGEGYSYFVVIDEED